MTDIGNLGQETCWIWDRNLHTWCKAAFQVGTAALILWERQNGSISDQMSFLFCFLPGFLISPFLCFHFFVCKVLRLLWLSSRCCCLALQEPAASTTQELTEEGAAALQNGTRRGIQLCESWASISEEKIAKRQLVSVLCCDCGSAAMPYPEVPSWKGCGVWAGKAVMLEFQ